MPSLISAIKIPNDSYDFQSTNSSDFILNLSKLNIFLGENNSGKSRLLRQLVKNDIKYIPTDEKFEQLNIFLQRIKSRFEEYIQKHHLKDSYRKFLMIDTADGINSSFNVLNQIEELKEHLNLRLQDNNEMNNAGGLIKIFREELGLLDKSFSYEQSFVDWFEIPAFTKYYIPILRGMRPLASTDLYRDRTVKDYFGGDGDIPFELFTGLNSYQRIRDSLLGNLSNRNLVKDYESYLSNTFFEGKPVALIPSIDSDVLTIKIGNEKEQSIYDLGDGIQTIITLTLPLFLNRGQNLLVFIEEPEIYLHPALQRKLLETLLTHEGFDNYQYFITTHSNHFLDLTMDYDGISIYSLKKYFDEGDHDEKDAKFHIENLSYGDNSALQLLGVRNSSVFLSNCTIWVEGITDRLYFRHYLKMYLDKYYNENKDLIREDYHYSFVEYGGGNITHWSFLEKPDGESTINVDRLCGKLFLIADKDKGKDIRYQKLKSKLGKRYYRLNCIEVENLLSEKVLLDVVRDYEGKDCNLQFEENGYKDVRLGEYLDTKLGKNRKRKTYKLKSGTILDKVEFCKKARSHIKEWDDLSEEAKKITMQIYNFICSTNNLKHNK